MKKFSKLILESKKVLWTKHPLVNPVDWDEIFKPLIEHIHDNLKSNVPPPGEGIFSSTTKAALDDLIDSISEDYAEYFKNVLDDGSQESFFNAFQISADWKDLMECIQPLLDRTYDFEEYPSWEGGYWFMNLINLKYENTDEFVDDIIDITTKLKMFKIDFKIEINSSNKNYFLVTKSDSEDKISKGIKSLLELPGQEVKEWIKGLKVVDIFLYNKETVQTADLD